MSNMAVTPIDFFGGLLNHNVSLYIKRDDLYPSTGGGNKARKAHFIVKHAIEKGYTALVTNGGVQSNHARAIALLGASMGLKVSLVLHDEHPLEKHKVIGNLLLMVQSGAKIRFCQNAELGPVMDEEVSVMKTDGYNPFYIWGGGHCVEGTQAYVDASEECRKQLPEGWIPDYIIHASGTGTTQAGLHVGFSDLSTKVIGVSIARRADRGTNVVEKAIADYCMAKKIVAPQKVVFFRDDWILGGYEKSSEKLFCCINKCGKVGIVLDPTYTGKAWLAMEALVKSGEIPRKSKVLFWHTGGLLNLLSSSVYMGSVI